MTRFRIFPSRSALLPPFAAVSACIAACLAVGCGSHDNGPPAPDPEDGARADKQLISSVRDAAVANAILAQHTLYPYHFVANGGELNALGERDLTVLADYYRVNPGDLNINRGDVPAAIYDARVRAVQEALARDGVEVARVSVSDQLPPGPGLRSEDVVHILQMNLQQSGKGYTDSSGGSGSAASGAGGSSGAGASSTGGGTR